MDRLRIEVRRPAERRAAALALMAILLVGGTFLGIPGAASPSSGGSSGLGAQEAEPVLPHPPTLSSQGGASGTTYYVDFAAGADANPGTSPSSPWKHAPGDPAATGVPANTTLRPGDTVVFRGSVAYNGTIFLDWSGVAGDPIVYDGNSAGSFGDGRAILDGGGRALGPLARQFGFVGGETWNGFEDVGVSYVTIDNFEIRDLRYIWNDTGGGWNNGPQGISIGGAGSNVTIENCWIHDVQPIALAVNNNSEDMGSLNAWTSVHVTNTSFTDSNVSLAEYAGASGRLARFKIYVGWGSDDYTIASAYLGPYWAGNNTLRVYQDLNLTMPGWNTAYSNPVGQADAYGYSIFNMTSGPMYGKQSADIAISTHPGTVLWRNTLADAGTGIDLSQDNASMVEYNDISNVSWGIAGGSGEIPAAAMVNVTIAFNHIHDFYPYVRYGYWSGWHGDGIYLFAGSNSYAPLENLLFEGNDFTGYIPEATADIYCEDADYVNVTIYDNVFAATGAYMIRISADPDSILNDVRVFNNDFVMPPLDQSPAILFQGGVTNVSLRNNVVYVPSGWGAVLSFDPSGLAPFGSDDNLLASDYAYAGDIGYNGTEYTLAQWVGSNFTFPHDQHSLIDLGPRFANYPDFDAYLSGGTTDNVTLTVEDPPVNPYVAATFRVGDRIEYDDDGVIRTVTAVGSGAPQPWVEFSPALSVAPTAGDFLTDWGNDTNFTMNLHLAADSPLIGAGVNLAGQVPAVDADGNPRPLSGAWDIGAYVYAVLPPSSLTGVDVEPSSASVNVGANRTLEAIAVCTQTCPPGTTYSWTLVNRLGTLNASTGAAVRFLAGSVVGNDTAFVNATLDGVTRMSGPLTLTVANPRPPSSGSGPPPFGVGGVELWAALSGIVAAAVLGVVILARRKRKSSTAVSPPDVREPPSP